MCFSKGLVVGDSMVQIVRCWHSSSTWKREHSRRQRYLGLGIAVLGNVRRFRWPPSMKPCPSSSHVASPSGSGSRLDTNVLATTQVKHYGK